MKLTVVIHGWAEIDIGDGWVMPNDREKLEARIHRELLELCERHAEIEPVPTIAAVTGRQPLRICAN